MVSDKGNFGGGRTAAKECSVRRPVESAPRSILTRKQLSWWQMAISAEGALPSRSLWVSKCPDWQSRIIPPGTAGSKQGVFFLTWTFQLWCGPVAAPGHQPDVPIPIGLVQAAWGHSGASPKGPSGPLSFRCSYPEIRLVSKVLLDSYLAILDLHLSLKNF